jgi:hypothetical protein
MGQRQMTSRRESGTASPMFLYLLKVEPRRVGGTTVICNCTPESNMEKLDYIHIPAIRLVGPKLCSWNTL